ncbi:hypothetical protein BGZ50_008433, partial [Haplosporangium sp. Z 11]
QGQLLQLQQELEAVNSLCQAYRSICEREAGQNVEEFKIMLKSQSGAAGLPQRQYDLPTSTEVAVLLPSEDTAD